jgi:hypothetical protein
MPNANAGKRDAAATMVAHANPFALVPGPASAGPLPALLRALLSVDRAGRRHYLPSIGCHARVATKLAR